MDTLFILFIITCFFWSFSDISGHNRHVKEMKRENKRRGI